MEPKCQSCVVCGDEERPRTLTVEGHAVVLCRAHAAVVTRNKPSTFEQLRHLFRPKCGLTTLADRRSAVGRRLDEDRRIFSRPEGRRKGEGRRVTDGGALSEG